MNLHSVSGLQEQHKHWALNTGEERKSRQTAWCFHVFKVSKDAVVRFIIVLIAAVTFRDVRVQGKKQAFEE